VKSLAASILLACLVAAVAVAQADSRDTEPETAQVDTAGQTDSTAADAAQTREPAVPELSAEALKSAEGRAAGVRSRLGGLEKWTGRWDRGDALSRFTAYLDRGEPVFVEEEVNQGRYAISRNEYFLDGGSLFYFAGSGDRVARGGEGKDKVDVRLAFDEEQKLVGGAKSVNGAPVDMDAQEPRAALAAISHVKSLIVAKDEAGPQGSAATAGTALPPVTVELRMGKGSTSFTGSITALDTQPYLLTAKRQQKLQLGLSADVDAAYFVVITPNGDILFDGIRDGADRWTGDLPVDGTYRIRVLMDRAADLTDETTCRFTLRLNVR